MSNSLFSNPTNTGTGNTSSSSLFGGNTGSNTSTSNLFKSQGISANFFGNNVIGQPSAGGSNPNPQQGTVTGSGQSTMQTGISGSSLFGGQQQNQQSGGGQLAGAGQQQTNQAQGTTQSSLFGNKAPTTGGTNAPTTNQPQQGSLFGNKSATTPSTGGSTSLFSSNQQSATANTTTQNTNASTSNQPQGTNTGQQQSQTSNTQQQAPTGATGGGLFNKPTEQKSSLFAGNTGTTGGTTQTTGGATQSGGLFANKPEEKKDASKPLTLGGGATGTGSTAGTTTGGTSGGLFGNQQQKQDGAQQQQGQTIAGGVKTSTDIDQTMRHNLTVEELLRSWKKDLDSQVENFQKSAKSLTQHEQDAFKNMQMAEQLNNILGEMEKEYKAIEFTLGGIDKGQDDLYHKLEIIEYELSNFLYPNQNNETSNVSNRTGLITLAKNLNTEIYQIEEELGRLVNEMNQPVTDKDSTQLTENILNNYFDALQWLEVETLKAMNKLSRVESMLSTRQLFE